MTTRTPTYGPFTWELQGVIRSTAAARRADRDMARELTARANRIDPWAREAAHDFRGRGGRCDICGRNVRTLTHGYRVLTSVTGLR